MSVLSDYGLDHELSKRRCSLCGAKRDEHDDERCAERAAARREQDLEDERRRVELRRETVLAEPRDDLDRLLRVTGGYPR